MVKIKNKRKTNKFFLLNSNIRIAGLENKEIQNKLNPYVPIIEVILSTSS